MKKLTVAIFFLLVVCGSAFGAQAPKELQEEMNLLRGHMNARVDEVEEIKWIYDKGTDRSAPRDFYVYLGQRDGVVWARLRMGFVADEWVFFEKIILNIDGERQELSFPYGEVKRDHGSGIIWEWVDQPAGEHTDLIKQVFNSKKTIIRFSGDYIHDFEISKTQKESLKRVWRLYELRDLWAQ